MMTTKDIFALELEKTPIAVDLAGKKRKIEGYTVRFNMRGLRLATIIDPSDSGNEDIAEDDGQKAQDAFADYLMRTTRLDFKKITHKVKNGVIYCAYELDPESVMDLL